MLIAPRSLPLLPLFAWLGCSPAPPPPAPPVAVPPPPIHDDCAAGGALEVRHHAIDLALRLDPAALGGHGEVTVRAVRDTALVALDARDLRVTSVATAEGPLRFEQIDGRLCAALPRALPAGRELTVRVTWEVATNQKTPRFAAGEVWAGYAASRWMPTLQDPAQRATLSLRVTTTPELRVAASGRRLPATQAADGQTVHAFVLDRPSPPFLYAFAAGRFAEAELDVDAVKLRAIGPAGADLRGALAITAPMMRFLTAHTGAPFPAAEYTQAFVQGEAAQEAAGLSLLGAQALDDVYKDPTEDWIFSHELAHQWFAWLVPCADFSDFWLNEGFATFLVAAIKEERWGRPAYDREVALWQKRSAKVHAEGKDAPVALSDPQRPAQAPPKESALQPRGVTYARGALVLHALRIELGDAVFWEGIRRYVKDRAGKGARTEDLRAALEAASGRDLRAFFATRVYAAASDG